MIDFSTPFQEFNNSRFLQEFLPDDLTLHKEDLIKQSYQKYITEGHILGTVKSLNLSVLEFRQASEYDPRVSLAKEAFRIMADHRIKRGLVIFWNPQTKNWRLSLMTISLDIDEKNKIVRNYSNAKRFSFLLGEGEAMKTPRTQLSGKVKDFEDLQKRFSVEVVRKEFFDDYIDLFIRLYIEISKDASFVKILSDQSVDRVKFTKNLLGKIIFVYFVQKKGWLGLNRDKKWGEGDKNFMRSLWERFASGDIFVRPSTGFFYNDYLEHLFYNGFNKDRRDDDGYEPNMRMKVPYLNGGLFKEDYRDWEHFVAEISNDIFSNPVKNGILDIFDTYNFTIDEDDLTDAEIAVDPEMLGKIFEKMISVSKDNIDEIVTLYQEKGKVKIGTELNKKFGAFYTPREIVHYMTRESLIAYLSTNTIGKKEDNESKIRSLIDAKDQHLSQTETLQLFGNDAPSIPAFAQEVDTYLQKVKIIDPAVGSGAFPMGILHEVTTLRYYLHSEGFCTNHHLETEEGEEELTEGGKVSMYQIKRETIKNSIYGVDIEPGAIDIARLRFWLSLVVDAEHPEPLPNFEFKFVCANTLIPLDEDTSKKQMEFGMLEEANLKTVKRYKREYYNADTKTEKIAIVNKLREYTKLPTLKLGDIVPKRSLQIDEFGKNFDNPNHSHTFFDASLMMSEWRGFDIVIGNPPYGSNIERELPIYQKLYLESNKNYFEIYKMFFHVGLGVLKKAGLVCYITPNTFLSQPRYADLRGYLLKNNINKILNLGENVFEDITVSVCISSIGKNDVGKHYLFADQTQNSKYLGNLDNLSFKKVDLASILNTNDKNLYISNSFKEDECPLFEIMEIKDAGIQYHRSGIGLKNKGGNDLYERIFSDSPDFFPQSIGTYYGKKINEYSIDKDTDEYFNLEYKKVLKDNESVSFNRDAFARKNKIIWRQTASFPRATIDTEGIWFRNTIQCGWIREEYTDDINVKYILGLLNSSLIRWKYNQIVREGGKVFPQIKITHLKNLPIKKVSHSLQQPIIDIVDEILEAKKIDGKADTTGLEKQINGLVYKLYGLTEEEIAIVEGK